MNEKSVKRNEKRIRETLKTISNLEENNLTFHIVCGDIQDAPEGQVILSNVDLAHSIDAAGDLSNVYDTIKQAVIKDLRSYTL